MRNSILDLRFVIGAFFTIIGIMLLVYGFVSGDTAAQTVNRWCGGAFSLFGIFMVILSRRKDESDDVLEH